MRRIFSAAVLAVLCTAGAATWAEPAATEDPMNELLVKKSLLTRLDGVRQNMSSVASDLVVNAMGFLGVPYKRGGNTEDSGFDCSGFVRAIYEQSLGLVLPRRAAEQASATQVIAREDLKPGDLVFFNTMKSAFSHVGIYVGDNKFIHSPRTGERVRVEDMRQSYWMQRFNGARRVDAASPITGLPGR